MLICLRCALFGRIVMLDTIQFPAQRFVAAAFMVWRCRECFAQGESR